MLGIGKWTREQREEGKNREREGKNRERRGGEKPGKGRHWRENASSNPFPCLWPNSNKYELILLGTQVRSNE